MDCQSRLPLILLLMFSVSTLTPLASGSTLLSTNQRNIPTSRPLNIAHRGSSGTHPEHTIEAYQRAVDDGADFIECDVTLTKDIVPVCIHENSLSRTTNVEELPEFADRRRNLTIGDVEIIHDWFAVDFTWVELQTLRKKQAEAFRDPSMNGRFLIPSFEEFMMFSHERNVGIYPELKDPTFLNSLPIMEGRRFEDIFLSLLNKHGYTNENSPCIIQSFSESALQYLAGNTTIKLAMLIDTDAANVDLDKWKSWGIDGLGVWTSAISTHHNVLNGYKNWINGTTDLVARAHARGLTVHIWTMRNEDHYLAWDFGQDIHKFVDHFLGLEVDGIFTDFPGTLNRYLDILYSGNEKNSAGKLGYKELTMMCLVVGMIKVLNQFSTTGSC